MAEFKLGRIKFVYQGTWAASTSYVIDDVVTNGGKTYICIQPNTSSSLFATDLATKWNLMADGTKWRNAWTATTYYNLGDMVLWGGIVYICKTAHTSATYETPTYLGLENNQSSWDSFAANFSWQGEWDAATRYKERDLVYYGGISYVCNAAHISSSLLETDLENWDTFTNGISYLGLWSGSSVHYRLNDVVKYGADLWICTTAHSSTGVTIDITKFDIFVNGFEFEGSWSAGTSYQNGDIVTYGGYTYTAIRDNIAQLPSTSTADWSIFTSGINFAGEWLSSTAYKIGNVVSRGSYTYVASADNTNDVPPGTAWTKLNSGIRWNATTGNFSDISGTNVIGIGTGATFDIISTNTTYTVSIHTGSEGDDYATNDTIKILGTDLGGVSPVNDLYILVTNATAGSIISISAAGNSVTWAEGTVYLPGDAVYYGVSSYICVSSHVGATLSNPIADTTGEYWNLLANGADSGVLTTTGDIVYYGENGPQRLPIGTDGQVLRVNNNVPSWSYYGILENIVYVSPDGADFVGNGQGLSLDKPWASVLFASRQIEEGYLNTNAGTLLQMNKEFVIKEVNNYIIYNYSYLITASSSSGSVFTTASTATMNLGMPIVFDGTTGGVVAGTTYYVYSIPDLTSFTISTSQSGGVIFGLSSSGVDMNASFSYDNRYAEQHTSTILDSVIFDLTHGGNFKTRTKTLSFFSTITSFITTTFLYELPQFVAGLAYLETYLIPSICNNSAPASNYQTLNGVTASSQALQIINTDYTSETTALTISTTLCDIIKDALLAGTYASIPDLARPHASIYVKTGTYNEFTPIVVPLDTAILGDELRSTIIQASRAVSNLVNDKPKTISAIKRLQSLVPAILANAPVTKTPGNTYSQAFLGSPTYSTATQSVITNTATIQTILSGGLAELPGAGTTSIVLTAETVTVPNAGTYTLSTPTGYNTSTLTHVAYGCVGNTSGNSAGYGDGVAQLLQNRTFLQTEIGGYLTGYTGGGFSWSGLTATQKGQSLRDISYAIDSVVYDMTYGGNTQSLKDGDSYYTQGVLQVSGSILVATVAALTRLKDIIDNIIVANTAGWTKSSGYTASQVIAGTPGSAFAGVFAQARVQDIIDWINNATANATIPFCSTWVNADKVRAYTNILIDKPRIQTTITNWVAMTYPTLNISSTLTYRDAGTITDALSSDMLLGATYYSMISGRAYYRNNASAEALVTGPELGATEQSINYISYMVSSTAANFTAKQTSTGDLGSISAVNQVIDNTAIIQDMLVNGTIQAPAFVMPTLPGYNTSWLIGYGDGVTQIVNNYQFIKDEIVNYLNNTLTNPAWSAYGATYQAETIRDLSDILDAIRYDMTYGCNDQSLISGRSYYSLNTALIVPTYLPGVLAALNRLSVIIGQIIQTTGVTPSAGNTTIQDVSATAGTAIAASFAQARIADILYWLNNSFQNTSTGTTSGTITGTTLTVSSGTGLAIGQCITGTTLSTYVTNTTATTNVVTLASVTGLVSGMILTFSKPYGYGTYDIFGGLTTTSYVIDTIVGSTVTLYNFGTTTSPILTTATGKMVATAGIAPGTYLTAGSGTSWTVSKSQTVSTATRITGTFTITPVVSGAYSLVNGNKQAAFDAIQARTTEIQNDAQSWVTRFYQNQSPSLPLTNRDAGYIVTALSYDILLDSNFYSIISGRAYNRIIPSVITLKSLFADSTYGSIGFIGSKVKQIAASGSSAQVQTTIDDMIANINGQPSVSALFNGSITGTILTVNSVTSGTITVGMKLSGVGIVSGVQIISGSGTSWLLNYSQEVSSITTTASKVTTGTNYITLGTTSGIVPGLQITFSGGGIGNLSAGAYYVSGVVNSTQITVSTSFNGSVFPITSTVIGVMTATIYGIYGGLGLTTTITGSSVIIPVTAVTTSTNLITVNTTVGLSVDMPVVFSSLPANITTTATATTVSGSLITVATTVGLVIGQQVWFTGVTFGGLVFNQIYYVKTIPTPGVGGTITISNTLGGTVKTVTVGSGTMTLTANTAGGLVSGNTYWINSISSATALTVTSKFRSNATLVITNSLTGLAAGVTAGISTQQGLTVTAVNGTLTYNNTLSTQQGGEILRKNIPFLANEMSAYVGTIFGGTVTNTTITTNIVTTEYAHNLSIGDPIIFSGTTFGNIVANTQYFVLTVPSSTTFTMTVTQAGTGTQVPSSLSTSSGTATVTYYYIFSKAVRDATLYLEGLIYDLSWTGNYKSLRAAQLYISAQSGSQANNMFHVRNGTGLRNMTLNGLAGSLSIPNSYGTRRPTAGAYVSLDPGFGPNDSNSWASVRSCYVQNITTFGSGCVGLKVDSSLHDGGNRSIVANDFTQVLSDGIGVWCTGTNSLTELVSVFSYYGYTGYLAELGGRIRATNGNSSYGTYGVIAEGIDSYEAPIYATVNNRANQAYITNVVTDGANQILRIEYQNAGNAYTNVLPNISGSGYNAIAVGDELRDAAVFETRLIDLNDGLGTGGSNYLTATNSAQAGSIGQITIANTDIALSSAYVGMRIQLLAGTGVGQYASILSYNSGTKIMLVYKPNFVPLIITASTTTAFTVASTATLYANMPIYLAANVAGLTTSTLYYVSATNFTTTAFSVSTSSGGGVSTLTAVSATPAVMASSTILATTLTVGTLSSGTITIGQLLTGTNVSANTYITANISGSGSGSTWTVSNSQSVSSTTITGTISVPTYAAGWDHVIPGYAVSNSMDLTSSYIIEPSISYTSPGFTSTSRTLSATATWGGVTYGQGNFVSVAAGSNVTSYSTNGTTWTTGGILPASTTWNNVVYGGGSNATATANIGGFGGTGAVMTAIIGTGTSAGQVIGITIVSGGYNYLTPPTIVVTPVSGGSGAAATCTVLNGVIKTVTMDINGGGYGNGATVSVVTTSLSSVSVDTWGKNYFSLPTVTISPPFTAVAWTNGGTSVIGTYYYFDNISTIRNYYLATNVGTFTTTGPIFTSGTSTNGTVSLTYSGTLPVCTATVTNYGVSSIAVTTSGYGYTAVPTITITDPQSAFVAISSASNAAAYQLPTALGSAWVSTFSNTALTNLNGLAYGNNIYIAVGGTSTTPSAVKLSGNPSTASWVSSPITGSVTYAAVAYGNGYFVAVPATSGTATSYTTNGTTWTVGGVLPVSTVWASVAYGNGRFVALAANGTIAYSYDLATSWMQSLNAGLSSSLTWVKISYGDGLFYAIASATNVCATSWDGVNWVVQTMPATTGWKSVAFGNPKSTTLGAVPTWVAISTTSGTIAASIATGAKPLGRIKVIGNKVTEVRMVEPGNGFPRGNVSATTTGTKLITVDTTANLIANQPIIFNGTSAGGITTGIYYYVVSGSITSTQFQISATSGGTALDLTSVSISGMTYFASPIITQVDPNRVNTAPVIARIGNGALGNPSFSNRGTANATATATVTGDGYSELYQPGTFINVANLYSLPTPGANIVFSTISGSASWYKLVAVSNILGIPGNYTATFQLNPGLSTLLAPPHGTLITTNLNYSQVRLTGHDFLYIGTGNQTATDYPNVDATKAIQASQQLSTGGGRVFFTSTDQDGNFNVGNLFGVQQSTGTATLNASAFNLSGLQSLTLGSVSLGVGSATITQFSTDPYFTANSDNIVPTQKAIKSFITSQIGGGASALNVNTLTAGQIYIAGNTIQNTTGSAIVVSSKMYFTGGIDGAPVALMFFNQR
jgi:hypothetical protein